MSDFSPRLQAALILGAALLLSATRADAGRICDAEADISRAAAEAQQQSVPLRTVVSLIEAQTGASKEARSYAKGTVSIDYSDSTLSPEVHADIGYRSCLEHNGDDDHYLSTLPVIAAALRAKY